MFNFFNQSAQLKINELEAIIQRDLEAKEEMALKIMNQEHQIEDLLKQLEIANVLLEETQDALGLTQKELETANDKLDSVYNDLEDKIYAMKDMLKYIER